jgi:5-methylcytosine-specific restriction protein A
MYDSGVFEELARAIEEVEIPVDGSAIATAFALLDRFQAKLADAAGRFDNTQLWDVDGSTSLAAWLRRHTGRSRRDAWRTAATASCLAGLPVTAQAWQDGRLTAGQIEAVCAHVDPATAELFAAHEATVVPALAGLSVDQTAAAMAAWKARAAGEGSAPGEPDRSVYLSTTLDARWVLDGRLDSLGGQTVATAVRLAETRDPDGEPARTPARRRADALVDVCRFFLDHQHHRPAGRNRPHLNVVIDLADLQAARGGRFVDGGSIDQAKLAALLCDSALHRLVRAGDSAILDYGTSTRTVPTPLWNALVLRDDHCRFPGCDRPAPWCEAHHLIPVEHNGPTRPDNLVLACSRHHHRLHTPGWHAKMRTDGTLEVTGPDGQVGITSPPRATTRLC